jgi:hypothetical protein
MRRSHYLLVIAIIGLAPQAFAQEPLSPYGDEPATVVVPAPPMPPAPPVPPPIVAPPPPQGYYQQPYYYYNYSQPQAPVYVQPQARVFHEELRPNYGLMVAGLVILGSSWSINAASAYLADEWKLAVPLVGPFMETQNINTGAGNEANRMLVGLLVFDGLIECAGAIMLVAGAITHHRVRVYDQPRVSVVPTAGPSGAGLAAFGRF